MEDRDTDVMTVAETTPLDVTPTIRFFFDGLFFFCFNVDEDKQPIEGQIGVLSTAPGHEFHITVIETRVDTANQNAVTRTKISFGSNHSLCRRLGKIKLRIDGGANKVERYHYESRINRLKLSDQYNFGWLVDFENGELHSDQLSFVPGVLNPFFSLTRGLFYSYQLSKDSYDAIKADTARREYGYMAMTMGVDINILPSEKISLQLGEKMPWPIPLKKDATYFVLLQNLRPNNDMPTAEEYLVTLDKFSRHGKGQKLSDISMGEMVMGENSDSVPDPAGNVGDVPFFYHAFTNYNALQQYNFEKKGTGGRGAKPLICYPSGGNKSRNIS
jgi:hypothetical protein